MESRPLRDRCEKPKGDASSRTPASKGPRVAAAAPRPVEIIKRANSGSFVQPNRWVIERTFAWACINRRLARDVERAAETVRALFQIAMVKLMAHQIAR